MTPTLTPTTSRIERKTETYGSKEERNRGR